MKVVSITLQGLNMIHRAPLANIFRFLNNNNNNVAFNDIIAINVCVDNVAINFNAQGVSSMMCVR